jgi:cell division protein FtsB
MFFLNYQTEQEFLMRHKLNNLNYIQQKLKDKLSNGSSKDEKSNLDDKIIGELQVTKEQNDKLAKENKTISDEKQQLVAEIAKLKNQIKESQQPSSVATSSGSSNNAITSKLEEENNKLLEENKRLKEVEATARKQLEMLKLKDELYQIISTHSGQTFERVHKDSERDYWMIADEAREYGMIDEVLRRKKLNY